MNRVLYLYPSVAGPNQITNEGSFTMFYILLANQKFMSFLKLATLCAASAIVGLWQSASPLHADEYGDFDSTGHYRYHNLPGNPSPGHDGWNSYQRQQEQMERYRQDSLNAEREYQRSLEPAPRLYNPSSTTILPNGRSMTCYLPTKGNPLNTCF